MAVPERTGRLKAHTLVMTWKQYDGIPGNDKHFYAEAGAPVKWDGHGSNAGVEDAYGGRTLLWTYVYSAEFGEWCSKGLEESEVEWDD